MRPMGGIKMKPCPFCGQAITEKPYTGTDVGKRIRQGVIKCSCGAEMRIHVVTRKSAEVFERLDHPFAPSTAVYSGDENDVNAVIQFTKGELVKRWNSRSGGNE